MIYSARRLKTQVLKAFGCCFITALLFAGCATGVEEVQSIEQETDATVVLDEGSESEYDGASSEYEGAVEDESQEETIEEPEIFSITMAFAGDMCLDETCDVMVHASTLENGVYDCIDSMLLTAMEAADICCINNEFAFSDAGEPMEGKLYTFRSSTANVNLLLGMGVDIVTLANNHVYDYGSVAFYDTLETLQSAGIDFVGAGANLEEAMTPVYYEINGVTIAFVNATRAEKYVLTPAATDSSGGVLRCYDTTLFEQVISTAAENADYVVCCVHWGTEYSYDLEDVQIETARLYIDAGADVIIGTHSHCLQGIGYYNGKPIFYSLGNFWFNSKSLETCLVQLELTGTGAEDISLNATFVPAIQEDCETRYCNSGDDKDRVLDLINSISVNAYVDDDGLVTEVSE